MKIYKIINSPLALLLSGFLLTGVVGSFLNYQFQRSAWKREVAHKIASSQMQQANDAVEGAIQIARQRFYSMQKVYWSLEGFKMNEANSRWEDYYRVKDEWNILVGKYRSKIKVFINPDLSYMLLDKDNAAHYKEKESLHAVFVVAHYKLKALFNYNGSDLKERRRIELEALQSLSEVGQTLDHFSDQAYAEISAQYSALKTVGE